MQFKIGKKLYNIEATSHIFDLKKNTLSYLTHAGIIEKINAYANAIILISKEIKQEEKFKKIEEIGENFYLEVPDPEATFVHIHNTIYRSFGDIEAVRGMKKRGGFKFPYSYFYPPVKVGRNCRIDAGAVIGGQGLRMLRNAKGNYEQLIHIGGVEIGNNVEIGANTCIDKGTYGNTVIKDYVRIDNLVHIAHNCYIDTNTIITPMVCLGGSTKVGKECWIGIGASTKQGVIIEDNAFIGMGAVVIRDVGENEQVAGNFAVSKNRWLRHHAELEKEEKEKKKNTEVMKF
jgi:UDP-3-O-[3-hydroxymyristoyl] glucosamine N-acyltransferase